MLEKIVFIILSVITLGSGMIVVIERNLFRAALYLVAALAGVAGMFVLLQAGFFAVVQVFIYAGAITILIIFAVMLTRHVMNPDTPQVNSQSAAAAGLAIVMFVLLALTLAPDQLKIGNLTLGGIAWPERDATPAAVQELGRALVDAEQFVVPFEVASVLLLVAMIGAVYIVFPKSRTTPPQGEEMGPQAVRTVGAAESEVEEAE